jgi:hypothetical protein
MLDVDPETRPNAEEVLDHPWLAEEAAIAPIAGGEPDLALVDKFESLIATLRKAAKK